MSRTVLACSIMFCLVACGGGASSGSTTTTTTTSGSDDVAAPSGPIAGSLYGLETTLAISLEQFGTNWSIHFDSTAETGSATGVFGLEGTVASGATLRSSAPERPGFLCDPSGANRNDSLVSYELQVTQASITACPAGITEQTQIGTASGRLVLNVRADGGGDTSESTLRGTFTDVPVYCFPTE